MDKQDGKQKRMLNLKPIQPGERRAKKSDEQRQDATIVLRVTRSEKARLVKESQKVQGRTLKDYLLEGK